MNKFHFTYLFSIFCILCTINCIAKSVCTTIPIAYSASNVKQRMAGGLPPAIGGLPPAIGGLPPAIGGHPPAIGGHPPAVGGCPVFINNGQQMVGWLPLFIQNTLPDLGNMVHYTGAVPP